MIGATPKLGVIGKFEPFVQLQATNSLQVPTLELLVTYLIYTIVLIVSSREEIRGFFGSTTDTETMLGSERVIFVSLTKPVGIAKVIIVSRWVDTYLLQGRISITTLKFRVPVIPTHDKLIETVVDGTRFLSLVIDIRIVEIRSPLQTIGHHLRLYGTLKNGDIGTILDSRSSSFRLLGCDEDDTECTTSTIYRCRGSILQY